MLAICQSACLTWSNDGGWCVVDCVAPAEDNVRCHRLLGLASARLRFWLYRDPGGRIVARLLKSVTNASDVHKNANRARQLC
jgi:hypothetical protein